MKRTKENNLLVIVMIIVLSLSFLGCDEFYTPDDLDNGVYDFLLTIEDNNIEEVFDDLMNIKLIGNVNKGENNEKNIFNSIHNAIVNSYVM